ncbi:MAG: ParB/RepB/Spo0J family partition protein [Patescibacteria group bacterium]
MVKPFQLGRGLGSLIPSQPAKDNYWGAGPAADKTKIVADGGVRQISPQAIKANPQQPRHKFDQASLVELAASIKEHGILQPLVVSERADGNYDLIVGERRWRAALTAGLATVPVIVRPFDEQQKLEIALVENIQRQDLNPLEEAEGYRRLRDEFNLTQDQIAKQVGKSRPQIANTLRLLELPESIKQALWDGKLTFGHAKVILSLETPQEQEKFFRLITAEGLPVRLAEAKAAQIKGRARAGAPGVNWQFRQLEADLQRTLGTKVRIIGNQKGKIEIEFYSSGDLAELVGKISGKK